MQKSILLLIFTLYSIATIAQKYKLKESTLLLIHENDGTPEQLTYQIYDKLKEKEDILSSTSELERCFFYTYFYLHDTKFQTKGNQNLKKDIRKIYTEQVKLTYSEFECFFDGFKGRWGHETCDQSKRKILCKINNYLFSNLESLFILPKKFNLSSLRNAEIEIENTSAGGKQKLFFSADGLFLKVIDWTYTSRYVEKTFDECGFLDQTNSYDLDDNLTGVRYETTNKRDWSGREIYYSNGKLFSSKQSGIKRNYHLDYILDMNGDTLSYLYIDKRDDKDIRQSYTKDLSGNISSLNGDGKVNSFSMKNDSIYIAKSKEAYPSSMFFRLKDYYGLSTKEVLSLDTFFVSQFSYNLSNDYDKCIENYEDALNKLPKYQNIDLKPFILVSCEINDNTSIQELDTPKAKHLNKNDLQTYRELFSKEMHAQDNVRHPDEWGNDSDFVKFMKPKVDEELLISIYKEALSTSISRAKRSNIPNNKLFKESLKNLSKVIDTLGNDFLLLKQSTNSQFIESLDDNEKSTLKDVSIRYKEVILDYYDRLYANNWKKSYGLEKNRTDYYQLITRLQLKHPNRRLFNQNNKSVMPRKLDSILEKYDEYLGEDRYQTLLKAEQSLFENMEGMDNFKMTPYNPYFMERDKKKRKFRRFNWLVN